MRPGTALASLASAGFLVGAALAAVPASAAPGGVGVVYDAVPQPLGPHYPSLAFYSADFLALGSFVTLADGGRDLDSVSVLMSSWACESGTYQQGDCVTTTPGSGFAQDFVLRLFEVTRAGDGLGLGDEIATIERELTVPYRPSADASCGADPAWGGATTAWLPPGGTAPADCVMSLAFTATFDGLRALDIELPDRVALVLSVPPPADLPPGPPYRDWKALNVALLIDDLPTAGALGNDAQLLFQQSAADPIEVVDWGSMYNPRFRVTTWQAPTNAACAVIGDATVSTNLDPAGWSFETRTRGFYEHVDGGLRVWTQDPNDSQAKSAGFIDVDYPLSELGEASLGWTQTSGTIPPGLWVRVEVDGDASDVRTLIYEPGAYGVGNWWSGSTFPGVGGGMGYPAFGTIDDFLASGLDLRVVQVGYSLGSGVVGDGVITSLTAGCTRYTFDLAEPTTPTSPATPTTPTSPATPTTPSSSPPVSSPPVSSAPASSSAPGGSPTGSMPSTGAGAGPGAVLAAVGLVVLGAGVVLVARRRALG